MIGNLIRKPPNAETSKAFIFNVRTCDKKGPLGRKGQ